MTTEYEPLEFTRADPFCTHCGTVARALVQYEQKIHDTCPCVCHQNKTVKAREPKPKKRAAPRGRK